MLRLAAFLVLLATPAAANQLQDLLPGAEQRGAATFRILGLPIYQAKLFTKGAKPLDWSQDFGIELTYKRKLSQSDLTDATLREMQRMGNPTPPANKLSTCFQDVSPGDRYLAVSLGPDQVDFMRNGQKTCSLRHPKIKLHFMSIFLGENSRSASFTRGLLR